MPPLQLSHAEIDLLTQVSRDLHPMLMLQGLVPLLTLPEEETLEMGETLSTACSWRPRYSA